MMMVLAAAAAVATAAAATILADLADLATQNGIPYISYILFESARENETERELTGDARQKKTSNCDV